MPILRKESDSPAAAIDLRTLGCRAWTEWRPAYLAFQSQDLWSLSATKDAEMIVSTYSALRLGLPFVILTQELNYIPSSVIQQKSPPPHLELVKYYFRPQFEELQSEFHDVKALGAAALTEWYKGLETLGPQSNADAARFEQWELQGGFSRISTAVGQNGGSVAPSSMSVTSHSELMQTFDNVQQTSLNSAVGTPSSGNVVSEISTPSIHEAQRADAEHRESKDALRDPNIQLRKRQQLEEEKRVAQANASRMWLELKIPARDKLQKFARDFIHQTWSDGRAVTRATAPKFAAEVLCHVRQRFDEVLFQEDRMLELKGTAFPQDQESLACRKLNLEDLKWVYEEFVKPHTERFGKELFLCHVCDVNQKLFAFEAVIQHFAAKHTNSLSSGTSIVYWKADWPLEPPFDPHPNIPWALDVTGTMSGAQAHQQARQGFHPRGAPSSVEGGPRGLHTFPPLVPSSPVWSADASQRINQLGYPGSMRMDSHDAGRFDRGPEKGGIRGSVAGSSIARSEVSGHTYEDGYGPRYHPHTFARPGPSNVQYYHGSNAGGRVGDEMGRGHSRKPATRREEPPHPYELGRGWEGWKQQGPISHSSMIYSYGDGSSRFSYVESLQRDGDTSVDGTSEAGMGSKATSRISLRREMASESRAPTSEIEPSRDETTQAATNAAVENFLNNFSPMVEENLASTKDVVATARAIDLQQPRSVSGLHSVDVYPQQHEAWGALDRRTIDRVSPNSPSSRQRPILPIREFEQPTSWADDPPTQRRYSPPVPPNGKDETTWELTHSGRYGENAERILQSRYDQHEGMRDVVSGYAMPSYEPQYFYDHDGRRYVQVREQSIEPYTLRAGEYIPDRFHEPPQVGGSHYLDNRRYLLERHVVHDDRFRAGSREYRPGNNDDHPAQSGGPPLDHYSHEEVALEPRTRSGRISTREIIYEPVEQPVRYTPRSSGAGHPGE
ncbi:hypothetical protein AYL99_02684 [Fonsecaea erecta]|uniref:Uncharacterized protein n=1 Tax=Fonsecaea erecta TaxID=1367422 RepID=A0A178ZUN0_9EURO|nr:hypothetical protein AYL99_02684 [Fonsecaea erecta]OAP63457.1 hypothetical protein AYL99_02684 [Fonsecaea erecta]